MIDEKNRAIKCDECKKKIEILTEDKVLHGWTDYRTAKMHGCYTCAAKYPRFGIPFIYETYFAGRYKDLPDGTRHVFLDDEGTYFIRDKEDMEGVAVELPLPSATQG